MRPANQEAAVGIATACGPREDNQDCALALPEAGIYAVADGMGGLADGRAAAELAVETIRKLATTLRAELKAAISNSTISVAPVLENLFWQVNEAVRSATTERYAPARPPPSGCTLTVAIVVEEFLLIAHVGDSRAYLLTDGEAQQLTEDHSVAAARMRRGRMTEAEARTSPLRNKLYQAVGTSEELDVDILEVDIQDGDRFLLCSDGLWEPLGERGISEAVAGRDSRRAAEALLALASDQGLVDNTTALVFEPGRIGLAVRRMEALRATAVFRAFSDVDLRRLAPYFKFERVKQGELVIEEGRLGQALYVLGEGRFAVERGGRPLSEVSAPSLSGELALLRDGRRTASLRALTDGWTLQMNRDLVEALIVRQPELGALLMRGLARLVAERLMDITDRLLRET